MILFASTPQQIFFFAFAFFSLKKLGLTPQNGMELHKKTNKTYKKDDLKEPQNNRWLITLDLQKLRSKVIGKLFAGKEFHTLKTF